MRGHGAFGQAERGRCLGDIKVEEHPQGDDLTLPAREPPKASEKVTVQALDPIEGDPVVPRQRRLPTGTSPARDIGVHRGTHYPRLGCAMPADLSPRGPRPSERLGHRVLCVYWVHTDSQDGTKTAIPTGEIELLEAGR